MRRARTGGGMQRELVIRAIGGDYDAFSSLVRTSAARQYAIATPILRDAERAQDAVHDALIASTRSHHIHHILPPWRAGWGSNPGHED
jgi:hypothetical protein